MLPDDSSAWVDKHGCQVINVSKEHLKDFPALIKWIIMKGYGRQGILKLRLLDKDRNDSGNVVEALTVMRKEFEKEIVTKTRRKIDKQFSYNPDAQIFYKATTKDHIYEYVKEECTADERIQFVNTSLQAGSYTAQSSNCCKEALLSGCIRSHCFKEIEKLSDYSDRAKAKQKKWAEFVGKEIPEECVSNKESVLNPILYGAGIPCGPSSGIEITEEFSMDNLNTILDLLEEKPAGIVSPYLYAGAMHSAFPWHIEDGGLYSLNYHIAGAPKLWFGFEPRFYGLVDNIVSSFPIDPGHAACRAVLADHKVLIADPEYFRANHGIPYTTVLQEPGEFVITFPFALHAGFNLGANLAIAINFADVDWLELAIHAPICACNETQVQINLTSILQVCRPDLLEKYLDEVAVIPSTHPRSILMSGTLKPAVQNNQVSPRIHLPPKPSVQSSHKPISGMKSRILKCPNCSTTYKENKLGRLRKHIMKFHAGEKDKLLRKVKTQYKEWKPKVKFGYKCKVCGIVCRGSITQVKKHHFQFHNELPFIRSKRLDL